MSDPQMKRVGVYGLGYVGCVSAACLASRGCRVVGVDVNPDKVESVRRGRSPGVDCRREGKFVVGRDIHRGLAG